MRLRVTGWEARNVTEETGTWEDRKARVRDAYYQRIVKPITETEDGTPTPPPMTGAVPLPDAPEGGRSERGGSSRSSSGMPATGTRVSAILQSRLESTMPAASMSNSSAVSMAWMVSPVGFSEQNLKSSIVDPSGSLVPGLASPLHASLLALATGRGEAVEDVVLQIAEFFVEAEDERAEGPLLDAVTFYLEQYTWVPR